MSHLSIQSILDELGQFAGLGPLPLDADGRLTLVFDGRIELTVEHEPDEGRVVLWTLLGELGSGRPPQLLSELLDANFLWQGTGGATLSLERNTGRVLLSQALPVAGLQGPALARTIETFISAATLWGRRIAAGEAIDQAPADEGDDSHLLHFVRA